MISRVHWNRYVEKDERQYECILLVVSNLMPLLLIVNYIVPKVCPSLWESW